MSEHRSDIRTEMSLLSACLDPTTGKLARKEARRHLLPGDFDDLRHENLWNTLSMLDRNDKSVDAAVVMAVVGAGSPEGRALPEILTSFGVADSVAEYAAIIRGYSVRRKLEAAGQRAISLAYSEGHPGTLAARAASEFIAVRDGQATADDVTAVTARELLEQQDDEPDWLIPGLLERRDRLMLTGEEGLGKSHMLRQIAVHLSAGLSPFHDRGRIEPRRTLIVDCENTWSQVRRKLRPAIEYAAVRGSDPRDLMVVDCTNRIDITRDRDLARIHQLLDAYQPDLVVIGPLYRLVPRALQTDDDTAPVLAALDTIRDRGAALLMEAHAGHAQGAKGVRDMRPRGSSSLMGWPEFGFGMKAVAEGIADFVPWRGQREERDWPQRVRRSEGFRWMPMTDLRDYGDIA